MSKNSLPDKCKHCGLRVKYDFTSANESMSSDAAFSELRKLSDAGYVPKFRRRVSASNIDFGSTEICAISSKSWLEPTKKCKHWVCAFKAPPLPTIYRYITTGVTIKAQFGAHALDLWLQFFVSNWSRGWRQIMRLTVSHSVRGTPKSTDFFPPVSLIAPTSTPALGRYFSKH